MADNTQDVNERVDQPAPFPTREESADEQRRVQAKAGDLREPGRQHSDPDQAPH